MSIEVSDYVGAELARIYDEWKAVNIAAAALLKDRASGEPWAGYRSSQFERLEARAASLAGRYQAMASAAASLPRLVARASDIGSYNWGGERRASDIRST